MSSDLLWLSLENILPRYIRVTGMGVKISSVEMIKYKLQLESLLTTEVFVVNWVNGFFGNNNASYS